MKRLPSSFPTTDPGTYPISTDPSTVSINYISDSDPSSSFVPNPVPATEGTLVISESTSEFISGTFNFKGTGTFGSTLFEVTSGGFKVKAD